MIVYVITAGDYSDYHIVGVTTDKKFAEDFCKRRNNPDEWIEYRVETYDTDDIMCLTDNMHFWMVRANNKGERWALECDDSISYAVGERNKVQRSKYRNDEIQWYVYVVAEGKEHAMKIGIDLIMQSRYRKEIEEGGLNE